MKLSLSAVALCLCLGPNHAHAQFGGEGKPTNDTSTIHSVCAPDGTQTIKDDYSGSVYVDHSATRKYMLPIDGARARGEWNEVLRLSDMSIRSAPNCYYAYFSRGQSLTYKCQLPEAKDAMAKFISLADGKESYQSLVGVAKDLFDSLQSGDAAAHCSN
ncbi:MAG: hypothetical protein ACRYGF_03360 [Janthinobacterium lividum]